MPNGSAEIVQKLWNYCNVLRAGCHAYVIVSMSSRGDGDIPNSFRCLGIIEKVGRGSTGSVIDDRFTYDALDRRIGKTSAKTANNVTTTSVVWTV